MQGGNTPKRLRPFSDPNAMFRKRPPGSVLAQGRTRLTRDRRARWKGTAEDCPPTAAKPLLSAGAISPWGALLDAVARNLMEQHLNEYDLAITP